MENREGTEGVALAWVVDLLRRNGVPFQAVGGLAARAYGATRPLVDLDFYIPMDRFDGLRPELTGHILWGPERYVDEAWDITFVKLIYAGVKIEFGDCCEAYYFDRIADDWTQQVIDFGASVWRDIMGIPVPVMPRAELVAYKQRLGREVDHADLAEIA